MKYRDIFHLQIVRNLFKKSSFLFFFLNFYFVFSIVDQKWNEMSKAKCDDEVVNILSSKYMPLTVNRVNLMFYLFFIIVRINFF